jgi:hypothetical protein
MVQRVYARVENLGFRACLMIQEVFAMTQLFLPLVAVSRVAKGIPSSLRSQ